MTMSKDDWKAVYAKDDDLKLTKARGNKMRRTTTPPIFSSGKLDILLIERCYQGRKPFGSSTQSTGASFDPDTLGKARTMETDHWSLATRWRINGADLEAKDAEQDAPKTKRSRSSTSSDRFVRSHCYHQYSAQPQKRIA